MYSYSYRYGYIMRLQLHVVTVTFAVSSTVTFTAAFRAVRGLHHATFYPSLRQISAFRFRLKTLRYTQYTAIHLKTQSNAAQLNPAQPTNNTHKTQANTRHYGALRGTWYNATHCRKRQYNTWQWKTREKCHGRAQRKTTLKNTPTPNQPINQLINKSTILYQPTNQ